MEKRPPLRSLPRSLGTRSANGSHRWTWNMCDTMPTIRTTVWCLRKIKMIRSRNFCSSRLDIVRCLSATRASGWFWWKICRMVLYETRRYLVRCWRKFDLWFLIYSCRIIDANTNLFYLFLRRYTSYGKSPLVFIVTDTKSKTLNIAYNLFGDAERQKYSISNIR